MSYPVLGQDTYRGICNTSQLRTTLFGKTLGELELQRDLLSVKSPISGSTLTAPDLTRHTAIRDPISGTTLQLSHNHAEIVAPVLRQQRVHARNFYLRNDVDIMIATLRKHSAIDRYTNEKIGTAGKPTGLAKELLTRTSLHNTDKIRHQHGPQQQQ